MKTLLVILLFIYNSLAAFAQTNTFTGRVMSEAHEPLIGATVRILDSDQGTVTEPDGTFKLQSLRNNATLVVSYIGFETDTVEVSALTPLIIHLAESDQELNTITISSSSTFIDVMEPLHKEVITEKELLKAACCNLSESFETNASVDVSYADAVTGTKMIQMLGLDGRFVQINRENIPTVRGLTSRLGLNLIPGTWIQSIDVGKGTGSVINGYESMTGQLNLEFKKPEQSEKLYLNSYANSFGRVELNANTAFKLNDKWSTGILTHTNYFGNEADINKDGFMDLPKARQFNLLNRYKYQGDRIVSQIGFNVLQDQKAGGQLGFDFGDEASTSPLYGFSSITSKAEVFGKTGILFPQQPYKGWGIIYSASYQKLDSEFGRRAYSGEEKTIYGNVIYQNIIGNSFHQYKTGMSFMGDFYEEQFVDSVYTRREKVPGAFFEYSFLPTESITLVAGNRIDFHNLYGVYYSPRLHLRYQLLEATTLRVSAGKGYRTPNILPDYNQIFVSSRVLKVDETLLPEEAWNFGGSLVQEIKFGEKKVEVIGDYFFTYFENQVVVDMDQNPGEVHFYNLDGRSTARSFQIEANTKVIPNLSVKSAYKFYRVLATIDGAYRPVPFISQNRFFTTLSYATKFDIWQADLTYQWYGRKRLPDTGMNPAEYQLPTYSPDFSNINAQISRAFRWGNVYLGSENLLGFRQKDPILNSQNPFDETFDASMAWGPIAGRMVYFGFRYKLH